MWKIFLSIILCFGFVFWGTGPVQASSSEQLQNTCINKNNASGIFGIGDLIEILTAFGPCGNAQCAADLNKDGSVDVMDLILLLQQWGKFCAVSPQPFPEQQTCQAAGGTWKIYPNGCADRCGAGPICTQAMTPGCDCGAYACWNGTVCMGTQNAVSFQGTITDFNDGCYVDGVCSYVIDGTKEVEIMTGMRLNVPPRGTITGLSQNQEDVGKSIEAFVKQTGVSRYTLYGSTNYYIRWKPGATCGNHICEENEYIPCPTGAQCLWAGSCPQDCQPATPRPISTRCSLKPATGSCKAAFTKFYFDTSTQSCKSFIWGGCGGVVPFETLAQCQNSCQANTLDPATACKNKNGTYDEIYRECLGIDQTACTQIGGQYNFCASACRHDPNAQVCTMQCVEVCQMPPSTSSNCCSSSLKFQGYQCVEDCGPPVVRDGDIPTYSCLSPSEQQTLPTRVCPICLSAKTMIDTPTGNRLVTTLIKGDMVYSQDCSGKRVVVSLGKVSATKVPAAHQVVHLVMNGGKTVDVSANHPLAGGQSVASLKPGDQYQGQTIQTATVIPYAYDATYDILPQSPTGYYWANGVLLDSTIPHTRQCPN